MKITIRTNPEIDVDSIAGETKVEQTIVVPDIKPKPCQNPKRGVRAGVLALQKMRRERAPL